MFNVVIFGAPGSGKGTQSEKLIETYGLFHISTGDVLRDQIARNTELGKTAEGYMSQGKLIPDELVINILADVLDANAATKDGVIFDGFPRTIPQAVALKEMLEARGTAVHAVVGLEVPEDELITRLLKRGESSGRSDDNLETIQKRLAVYNNQTSPLKDYYVAEGSYLAIKGNGTMDEVFNGIRTAIDAKVK